MPLEVTPLDSPPESRPRLSERPCPACGLLLEPLRAPVALVFDDGMRFLCGPQCEQAFRAGTRRSPSESGRAPRAPRADAEPRSEPPALSESRQSARAPAESPAFVPLWLALGATGAALLLGLLRQWPLMGWAADACSSIAAGAALWAVGPLARDEGWANWLPGPFGVWLTVLANHWAEARGLSLGLGAEQAAIAAALVCGRVWLARRARQPLEHAVSQLLSRPALAIPEPRDSSVTALARAEHARRLRRAVRFGDGSELEPGRATRLGAAWARWGAWASLGAAFAMLVLVPGPAYVRCASAAAVLLCAPLLVRRAIAGVVQAAGTVSATHGIFFRGEASMDTVGQCKTVVLSPRGLLTERHPIVIELRHLDRSVPLPAIAGMAAAAEQAAGEHPLAQAIRRFARERRIPELEVRRPLHHLHKGVTCISSHGQPIAVGSRRLMMEQGISVALADRAASDARSDEQTEVFIALDDRVRALMALHYELHADARPALQHLVDLHLDVLVLTGDQLRTVRALASSLDIEHVKAELLPEERGQEVRKLRASGESVAAIGWSGEDDAALLAADAAIAIGVEGRVAESFAVVVANGHLREAAAALWLARALRDQVLRITVGSAATFVLLAVGAATGLLPPALAALACAPVEVYSLGAGARLLRRFALMLPARD